MSELSRRSVRVYDPDTGEYLGSVDVCVHCGEASCGTWTLCAAAREGMTPAELGRALAALWPPITDAQALEAARILANEPGDNR